MAGRHSRIRNGKRYIWYTDNLWKSAAALRPFEIEVEAIRELDEDCSFGSGTKPTLREVAKHCKRINSATFDHPIILNVDGSLMDGGHRVCKALLEGRDTIPAVRFTSEPVPDEIQDIPN